MAAQRCQIMAADTLIGDRVKNTQGVNLGRLENIILDMGSGCIAYAVLSCENVFDMDDRLLAISWHVLRLDNNKKYFVLEVDINSLKKAPRFNFKDTWPQTIEYN